MRATIIVGLFLSQTHVSAFAASTVTRTPGLFSADDYAQMRAFFAARPQLTPTPARALPALARELGLAALVAKDESGRFGLNAFKLLGARFAIETLLAEGELRRGRHGGLRERRQSRPRRGARRARRRMRGRVSTWRTMPRQLARDAIAGEGAEVDPRRRLV